MARAAHDPSRPDRVETDGHVQRRRRWTFVEKLRAAQEASAPGTSVSSVARKYGMAPSQLFRWRKMILSQGLEPPNGEPPMAAELRELKHQVRELERLLGKKTLENETLREAIAQSGKPQVDSR